MGNNTGLVATLHSRGVFKIKPNKFDEFKNLVIESQKLIEAKRSENGPMTWDASFDKENNVIYIDCTFENLEAELFHENNIKEIIENAIPLLDGPPESITSDVFSFIDHGKAL